MLAQELPLSESSDAGADACNTEEVERRRPCTIITTSWLCVMPSSETLYFVRTPILVLGLARKTHYWYPDGARQATISTYVGIRLTF